MSTVKWTIGLAVLAVYAYPASAQESIQTAFNYNYNLSSDCACAEPSCEVDEPACCCEEPSCGCDSGCCDSGCGGGSLLGDCCLGDPWTLQGYLQPCCDRTYEYGGWVSIGYHTDHTRFSDGEEQLLSFNDHPDHVNLHQAWFYAEKVAEGGACSTDWGARFDILYGTDAQKTQAFGNDDPVWDVTLDNGVYGWAMPQLYLELARGDWSVKIGHFFTYVGYEVVPAPQNFFYSHSYTLFNSEPFTHTGVLGEYAMSDDTTIHMGWVLGWDSGFDQFDDANAIHAGFIHQATDDVSVAYMMTGGNLGWRGTGYSHSVVVDVTLSEKWEYVLQSDHVNVSDVPDGNGGEFDNTDIGVNQYLFYTVNDCWAVGGRMEWWKSDLYSAEPDSRSYYELTGGINYRPHANVIFRPEVRYNWTPSEDGYDDDWDVDFNQTVFGIDAILTY